MALVPRQDPFFSPPILSVKNCARLIIEDNALSCSYALAYPTRKLLCFVFKGGLFEEALLSALVLSSRFLVAMGVSGSPASLEIVYDVFRALRVQSSFFFRKSRAVTLFKSPLSDGCLLGD